MEELLKEVALSERRKKQIDSFVKTVTEALQSVPSFPKVEVCISSTASDWAYTLCLQFSSLTLS